MRHNHGIVACFQAGLHGGFILKHIQSTPKLGVGLGQQESILVYNTAILTWLIVDFNHHQQISMLAQLGGTCVLHTQCATTQESYFEVCHQVGLVDHRPSCRIDQHCIGLHQRQPLLVDEVVCGRVQVAVQAHDLGERGWSPTMLLALTNIDQH